MSENIKPCHQKWLSDNAIWADSIGSEVVVVDEVESLLLSISASDLTQQQRDEIGAEYLEQLLADHYFEFCDNDHDEGFKDALDIVARRAYKLRIGGEK